MHFLKLLNTVYYLLILNNLNNLCCHGNHTIKQFQTICYNRIMALLTFHSTPLVQEYQSTWISRASFFACLCFLVCAFAPFLVAYSSHGFWVKHHVHREKPNVSFKYQALLLARSPTSEITWSTFAEYNLLNSQYLHFPSITVSERDENDDGFMDGLDLKLEFESYETINFINMILIFSYRLKDISTINMESLGVIQYDSGIPLTGLHFVGDLQWVQKRMVEFRQTDNRYNQTIVRQFEISDLLRAYNARDYGTELLNGHYLPIHGPSDGLVRIHTYIRYTEAMLEYAPGLWNVLKWAWIQYASVLLVFVYAMGVIKNVVFSQQMVPTWNEKRIKTVADDSRH
ncbi:transmembrane protein 231-like isoform X2 [Daphnia magna]|uniref:transmembrane protein 231-like isoform X2 n=1 Tax=Daphnia magna TaxID=35525 RepID=UPI001E1BA5BC|nr:transmembrane protein 231-like isoform X2 [Daphnia magna]